MISSKLFFSIFLSFFVFQSYAQTITPIYSEGPYMNTNRMNHICITLPDGSSMLIGGHGSSFTALSTAEFYSTSANSFSSSAMNFVHDFNAVASLADGKILIAGSADNLGIAPGFTATEIFDPVANSFTQTGSLNYGRMMTTAARINDGRVLVVGGWYDQTSSANPEIYDPVTGTFAITGQLLLPRSQPLVVPTDDGGAIVFSGSPTYGGEAYKQSEYFDHSTNTFSLHKSIIFEDPYTDWIPYTSLSYNRLIEDQKLADGKYLFLAYKMESSDYVFSLFTFDPATKEFEVYDMPVLPNSTEAYFVTAIVDSVNSYIYLPAIVVNSNPVEVRLYAVNQVTKELLSPTNNYVLPSSYYLSSCGFNLLNDGRILVSGGHSQTGYNTNFTPINNTFIITPNVPSSVENSDLPDLRFEISNFPNPFNASTKIKYSLPNSDDVNITIYDILGSEIATVVNEFKQAGEHEILFQAKDLPSGVYFCSITSPGFVKTTKLVLLR